MLMKVTEIRKLTITETAKTKQNKTSFLFPTALDMLYFLGYKSSLFGQTNNLIFILSLNIYSFLLLHCFIRGLYLCDAF